MKKISLFIIIDNLFVFIFLFIINLIWSLYFIKTPFVSIICSIFISIAIMLIYKLINYKKNKRQLSSIKEQQHMEDIKNTFIFMPTIDVIDFFHRLTSSKHKATKTKKYICINENKKIILIPYFKTESLTLDRLIELYNYSPKNADKTIILCTDYDSKLLTNLDNFNTKIILLNYKETYFELLKKYEFYPKITINKKAKEKINFKQILLITFNKKKTKSYITSALFIIFASFFVPYKIYYLIIATILLTFAILCRCEKLFKSQAKESIF